MRRRAAVGAIAIVFVAQAVTAATDLSGTWRVKGRDLDGIAELPGTLADARLGRRLTTENWRAFTDALRKGALTRAYEYLGEAAYSRTFRFSRDDQERVKGGGCLKLVLERVMWTSRVTLDGKPLGTCDSLATAHVYPIPADCVTDGEHHLEIAVDNSPRYGLNGYSNAYGHIMQTVWHGVRGRLEVCAAGALDRARIFAAADGTVRVENVPAGTRMVIEKLPAGGRPVPWSPEHPRLYTAVFTTADGAETRRLRFGYRTIETRGNRFFLNGRPFFLRGNVEACNFPLTGAPAMDVAAWRRIFLIHRQDGYNAIRFHSWCPPAAAFEAADEVGVFLLPEANVWHDGWNGGGVLPGRGQAIDDFIQAELDRILAAYGNSPSFFSLAIGSELAGGEKGCDWPKLNAWMRTRREKDPRRLYMIASGRGCVPGDDFSVGDWVPAPGKSFAHRIQDSSNAPHAGTDWDFENQFSRALVPHVCHEVGKWVVFPRREELAKYQGVLRPFDRAELVSRLDAAGLAKYERRFHDVSAKMNRLLCRDELEGCLRTPSCAGFETFGMQDFSGRGEALVGWRDGFYELKPGFRSLPPMAEVINARALLARFPKRVWRVGETFTAELQLRNLSETPVYKGETVIWTFGLRRCTVHLGRDIAPGELVTVARVSLPLSSDFLGRQTLRLGGGEWSVWVLPAEQPAAVPAGVTVTDEFKTAVEALEKGGRVIFTGAGRKTGRALFKSVRWSAACFKPKDGALPPLLGAWVDHVHPALKGFPTADWTDWQWMPLVDGARVYSVAGLAGGFEPIVQGVPDFHHPHALALLFELKAMRGRLLVCGFDLNRTDPASVRFRNALLNYASSEAFVPKCTVSRGWFAAQFAP